MLNHHNHHLLFLLLVALLRLRPAVSQLCPRFCGAIPLFYPFSGAPGCGDPRFAKHVTCNGHQLTLTTHTGSYPITSIDYDHKVVYVSDPTMSTCFYSQPSHGFSLDFDAPFSFHDSTVFALIDCSLDSSPVYAGAVNGNTSAAVPECANAGTTLCSSIYSCQPISQLNVPISTCCVYAPVDLGPAFDMDLDKLRCKGYTAVYSFNGQETVPAAWKYGIALDYKFNVKNEYPEYCRNCEKSGGACGYTGTYNAFTCNCPNGVNSTVDCSFQSAALSGAEHRFHPWSKGSWLLCFSALLLHIMLQVSSFLL